MKFIHVSVQRRWQGLNDCQLAAGGDIDATADTAATAVSAAAAVTVATADTADGGSVKVLQLASGRFYFAMC